MCEGQVARYAMVSVQLSRRCFVFEEFLGRVEASFGVRRQVANGLPNLELALEGV